MGQCSARWAQAPGKLVISGLKASSVTLRRYVRWEEPAPATQSNLTDISCCYGSGSSSGIVKAMSEMLTNMFHLQAMPAHPSTSQCLSRREGLFQVPSVDANLETSVWRLDGDSIRYICSYSNSGEQFPGSSCLSKYSERLDVAIWVLGTLLADISSTYGPSLNTLVLLVHKMGDQPMRMTSQ